VHAWNGPTLVTANSHDTRRLEWECWICTVTNLTRARGEINVDRLGAESESTTYTRSRQLEEDSPFVTLSLSLCESLSLLLSSLM